MVNTHYIIPPQIRLVEIMTSGSTREDIFPFLEQQFYLSGMMPLKVRRESTGFIVNRVWAAIKRECLMVLSEGVASPAELDSAWTEMFNKAPPPLLNDGLSGPRYGIINRAALYQRSSPTGHRSDFLPTGVSQ